MILSDRFASLFLKFYPQNYDIQYQSYFFNHLWHGIIAIFELGGSDERIQRFINLYTKQLRPAPSDNSIQLLAFDDVVNLMGKRKAYPQIYSFFNDQYETHFRKDLHQFVKYYFPKFIKGMTGAALHPLIHLGFGYHAKAPFMCIEAISYAFFTYESFESSVKPSLPFQAISTPSISVKPIQINENSHIRSILTQFFHRVKNDKLISDFLRVEYLKSKDLVSNVGEFQKKLFCLYPHLEVIEPYATILAKFILKQKSNPNLMFKTLIDSALWLYLITNTHDFFLLHGVTGSWALSALQPIVYSQDQLVDECIFEMCCRFVAIYVIEGEPELGNKELESYQNTEAVWEELRQAVLNIDTDEHIYKLFLVCYQMNQTWGDEDYLYYNVAKFALTNLDRFHFTQPIVGASL